MTLTGPGGTGKTRLALQLAADAADAFADGVYFVSLDAVRDPGLVASQIATSLGLLETGNRPTRDQLADWLAGKAILLVLDNFEQVIDAAPLVADLLRAARTSSSSSRRGPRCGSPASTSTRCPACPRRPTWPS